MSDRGLISEEAEVQRRNPPSSGAAWVIPEPFNPQHISLLYSTYHFPKCCVKSVFLIQFCVTSGSLL